MKKILLLGSALAVFSSSAFATEARLLGMGMKETDNEGLYYIQDGRNIFQNPANINLFSNQVVMEYGKYGKTLSASGTRVTLDDNARPKAQGGFFKRYGDMNYGLYVGNESNTSSFLRIVGTSAASAANGTLVAAGASASKQLQTADNQLDFFIGGDQGYKWAANLIYANGKDDTSTSTDNAISTRFGVIGSNWDAHLNVSLASTSKSTDTIAVNDLASGSHAADVASTSISQEFKGKLGVQVGGSYLLNKSLRVFGYVKRFSWEQTDSFSYTASQRAVLGGQNGTISGDFTSTYVGIAKDYTVNNSDKLITTFHVKETDVNLGFTNKGEVRHFVAPITLAYEANVNEWLTLRGSIIQNIYGMKHNRNLNNLNLVARSVIKATYGDNGRATLANSNEVNAGATLKFGQLSIDGVISTTDANRAAIDTTTTYPASTKHGVLALDNLLTRVGMTYKF